MKKGTVHKRHEEKNEKEKKKKKKISNTARS